MKISKKIIRNNTNMDFATSIKQQRFHRDSGVQ